MPEKTKPRKLEISIRVDRDDSWVNVRSKIIGTRYRADVRQQGYSLSERRWSSTITPLTEAERRAALARMDRLGLLRQWVPA